MKHFILPGCMLPGGKGGGPGGRPPPPCGAPALDMANEGGIVGGIVPGGGTGGNPGGGMPAEKHKSKCKCDSAYIGNHNSSAKHTKTHLTE